MSFTNNQNLEVQVEGQADWDSALNANFQIIDRGWHITLIANEAINTGDILWASSGAYANVYDPNSLSLRDPVAIAYKAVSSGESDLFLARGIINSIDIWSGNITPGLPVFIDVVTPGFAVDSFSAAWPPIGLALDNNALYFSPGHFSPMPEELISVTSLALVVGSNYDFTIDIGHRGTIHKAAMVTDSYDNYTLYLWSGSAKVSSERVYESVAVTSLNFLDQAGFSYANTDVTSPGLLFGRISANSGASVTSGDIGISITAERFR